MTDSLIGQTIDGFHILERIGEGGVGVVYKALDTSLHRNVALKFLQGAFSVDAAAKERFVQEARTASALDHPNICTIYRVGETPEGVLYISMALYGNDTLRARMRGGPLPFDEVQRIVAQIASALAAAHGAGIVHRDIKPENICLTADGTVKVLDFGLARIGAADESMEDATSGTVSYMSPEQLRLEDVDGRTDVWSLGVLLHEMLEGRPPFRGDFPAAIVYSILNEEPDNIARVRDGVPAPLRELADACLRKDRTLRPDAQGVLAALERSGAANPNPASFSPETADAPRARRRRMRLAFAAGALCIILLGVASWRYFRGDGYAGPEGPHSGLRIGILPFLNRSGDAAMQSYSDIIPELLLNEMIGREGLVPLDPMSFQTDIKNAVGEPFNPHHPRFLAVLERGHIDYVITGWYTKSPEGFLLFSHVLNGKGDVAFSPMVPFASVAGLSKACRALFAQVADALHVSNQLQQDASLKPWMGQGMHNLEAQRLFLQAKQAIYRGETAREYLLETLEKDSTFIAARVWLISGLLGTDTAEARQHYRVLLHQRFDCSPFDQAMIRYVGAALNNDQRLQVDCLEQALRLSPNNFILLSVLEDLDFQNGDFEKSLRDMQPSIDAQWEYAAIYPAAATCLLRLGLVEKASELIENAIGRGRLCADTWQARAAIAYRRGDSARARSDEARFLQEYLKSWSSRRDGCARLADGHLAAGEYGPAAAAARQALLLDDEHTSARLVLAQALLALERDAEAKREIEKVLAREPGNATGLYLLGSIRERSNNTAGAMEAYRAYLAKESATFRAIKLLARFPGLKAAV